MGGPAAREAGRGVLPFHSRAGPGPTRARLHTQTERGARALHRIWDTFGVIRGSTYPDEWVLVGAHRDAWSPGAADNISGCVTVLEAARAFAELARAGLRPARPIMFATWDAEEWGLIGSTEGVEARADSLAPHALAYVTRADATPAPPARRATASGLPLDYVAFGAELTRLVAPLDSGITKRGWTVSTRALRDALAHFTDAARGFATARDGARGELPARARRVNAALMQVERRLTRPQGLTSRPWYRSLPFASDLDTGYAPLAFPSVNEAIRDADSATTDRDAADLGRRGDQGRRGLGPGTAQLR